MRIIAGTMGGRKFNSPGTSRTHPMSDKMRGALFNILGDIDGLTILDAFGGSGALSFEAISRGASHATVMDNDRQAQQAIESNIKSLGLSEQVDLIKVSAATWLQNNPGALFDLVLCDPPYDDLQNSLIEQLVNCVKSDGLLVLSYPGDTEPPVLESLQQIQSKNYGDAQLAFYKA